MNKGTAIVGFLISFLAGMFLMWGLDKGQGTGTEIAAEGAASGSADHGSASVPVTDKDPSWGKADAPVTIVEISDFQCPFCSRVGPTLKDIKQSYGPDKVRLVWKHNPLPFHKQARPAHEAAATVFGVAGSDAFWKFHDLAFANQRELTEENFEKWAGESGADVAKFKAAYAAKKYASKVDEDLALSRKIGASGTPAFRINGVTLSGAQPVAKFKEVIDEQLAEAKKLVASGTKPAEVYVALTNKNQQATGGSDDKPAKPADQKPAEDDKSVWKVPVAADDPVRGPNDALVTMIIYSDYQCPFCKRVEETLDKVAETYKNDLRMVWKDNALPFHKRAKPAAALGRAAYAQKGNKGFWDAHKALFASAPKLEDADLQKIADDLGLGWGAVKAAIDSDKFGPRIQESMDQAADFQARGTPHFFVNGVRLSGAQPFEKFKAAIDEQLEKAKALVAKGTPRSKVYEEITKDGKGPAALERKEIPAPDITTPWVGGANAKVVIQEFSEFQCPFCKRVGPTIEEIKKTYGDKVKIAWRHLPLPFHKDAPMAAQAAHEAFAQKGNDGFWKMHDKLFENQSALGRENLEKYAGEIGLDLAKFKAALDSEKHKGKVEKDSKIGESAGINGTPGFVINGYVVSGAQPFSAFKTVIDKALKEAK